MRAVGLHPDVFVVTSRFWQTTCTLVRSGEEAFCVDSPVLPDELEILPAVAEQAAFRVVGLLATHADWDHLLGRYAFPEAPLGVAESTALRLRNEPGDAQRKLRDFDEENYMERPGPLGLPGPQVLPVPGRCDLGEQELELHADRGPHRRRDGGLGPVGERARGGRLPLAGRDPDDLRRRLAERLPGDARRGSSRSSSRRRTSSPATAGAIDGTRAAAILREDRAYLEALRDRGADAPLPLARRTGAQKAIHTANVAAA